MTIEEMQAESLLKIALCDAKVEKAVLAADPSLYDLTAGVGAVLKYIKENHLGTGVPRDRIYRLAEDCYDGVLRLYIGEGLCSHMSSDEFAELGLDLGDLE